jgi:methionyl-tRNA formyltransferase
VRSRFTKILVFGTVIGIEQVLNFLEINLIAGIVAPEIRPREAETIKKIAIDRGISFFSQPRQISDNYQTFIAEIQSTGYDMIFSNCYSMIISPEILSFCRFNAINVHWSLLPLNRGPNPVQWALINGSKITGVTLHFMDENLDSGDVIMSRQIEINERDTWVTLSRRLLELSQALIEEFFKNIKLYLSLRKGQNELIATKNFRINSEYPRINFNKMTDFMIFNLVRAQVYPLKGAFIEDDNKRKKYFKNYLTLQEVSNLRKKYERADSSNSST